jgi:PAP2 superfamily protein
MAEHVEDLAARMLVDPVAFSGTRAADATPGSRLAFPGALASGTPPVVRASLVCSGMVAGFAAPIYHAFGLSFAWETLVPHVALLGLLLVVWVHHQLVPDRRQHAVVKDLILAMFLLQLLTNVLSPAQYAAVALKRPLIDHSLAAADAALGVHVPHLTAWTRAHATVGLFLGACYGSLLPQFVLAPIAAALLLRNRQRLWEYVFHFHFCAIATVAALAIFPAACAFTYYGFESTLSQARFIHHFQALRDGSFVTIRFDDLEGLVSFPSFHTAGALMITWTFRGYRRWFVPVAVLNLGLIASTVMTGAHYFIDVIATVALFVGSLAAFRLYGVRLMPTDQAQGL